KHFQVNAQVAAESIFQRLDPRFMPRVWLVGFLARERPEQQAICVVPDDAPFPADAFQNVPVLARQLAQSEPEPLSTSISRKAEERRQARIQLRSFQAALQRTLDRQTERSEDVAYCSWPALVEDYNVFAVLQLPREIFLSYHSLRKSHVPAG